MTWCASGVARDVRQAFLGDAVDGELRLGAQRWQLCGEPAVDGDGREPRERGRQLRERADEPEVLEHLRSELARDAPHLLQRLPDRVLRLDELVAAVGGDRVGDGVQLEEDAREHLADLVVQAPSNSQPLCLLGGERAAPALVALGLQPVEHLVERVDDASDLVVPARRETLPRLEEVDGLHPPRKLVEGRERATQEHDVRGQREAEPDHEHDCLGKPNRPADGDRREEKEQRRQRKERRVDREDPPEERKCRSTHLEDRLGVLPPRSAHLSGPRPVRDSSRTSTATNTASTRATPTNVAVMKSWGSMATSSADASAIVTAAARSSRAGSRRRRARLSWRDP